MLSALSMREVGTIILVNREAETAFERSDVILEEVGVFVEIDGFKGEFAQSLSSISVCA